MHKSNNSKEQNSSSDEEVTNKLQYTQKGMNIESKTSDIVPGTDEEVNPDAICCNCNKPRHYVPQCPMATVKFNVTNNIVGIKVSHNGESYTLKDGNLLLGFNTMSSENTSAIEITSILIDSGSNCSVFKIPDLLTNKRKSDELLRAYTNGGHQDSYMNGHYKLKYGLTPSLCLIYCPYHKGVRST